MSRRYRINGFPSRFQMKYYTLNYRALREDGFACYRTDTAELVFTLRGCCMVDVFDIGPCRHIAYLDFDMQKDVMLSYAFGSPLIGLPFTPQMRRAFSRLISPFKDLRSGHDVGLYIEKAYRNKAEKKIWNLDVILLAIVFEIAYEHGIQSFTIKPTGDRATYYRRKFGAQTLPTTATELILSIDLGVCRKNLKNIQILESGAKEHFFRIKGVA